MVALMAPLFLRHVWVVVVWINVYLSEFSLVGWSEPDCSIVVAGISHHAVEVMIYARYKQVVAIVVLHRVEL